MTFESWLRGLTRGTNQAARRSRHEVSRSRRSSPRLAVEVLEDRTVPSAVDFALAQTFATGSSDPVSVAHADFNNDSAPDLAVANQDSSTVGVLLGDGTGGFAPAVTFASGGAMPTSIAVGDFNDDGSADLGVVNATSATVAVLLGDGLGGFAAPMTFSTGGLPLAVAVADFNNDGHDDLAVTNGFTFDLSGAGVAVLLGDGTGGFGLTAAFSIGAPSFFSGIDSFPYSVAAGDFDNDSNADLAVSRWDYDYESGEILNNTVGVLLGDGSGSFAPVVTFASGGFSPNFVAVADFNMDGGEDLVVTNNESGNVGVLLGNGAGGFAPAVTIASGGSFPGSLAVGDFNNDGLADLAVAHQLGNVGVLLGDGQGGFAAPLTVDTGGAQHFSIVAADFNNDGRADLAVANLTNGTVGVLLNATNQPPVNTVPGDQVVSEDVTSVISGLSVADDDAAGVLMITLTVEHGTLTLNDSVAGGLTATVLSGNGTATVMLTGTQAQINATLAAAGVTYLGGLDYSGLDTLTMTTTDVDGLSDTDLVTIEVLSAQQQAELLAALIADLGDDGVLSGGQENALIKKLSFLSTPNAENKVQAFINQIHALVNAAILTQDQADELINAAESIMVSMQ